MEEKKPTDHRPGQERDYVPIACSLHDQYLAWATERRPVRIEHLSDAGQRAVAEGIITDVSTHKDRSEWLTLNDGTVIRLDRIVRATSA